MKRLLVGLALVLVVLVVVGLFLASFFLGSIVKKGVERAGPSITQSEVKLDGATLAPFSGKGQLKGLVVGNPPGFKSPNAIQVGAIDVAVEPKSLFADKAIVHSLTVTAPEVTLEGTLQGNNLSKLLDNIRSASSSSSKSGGANKSSDAASRKIQIDDLLLSGGKINLKIDLLGTRSATVPLPEIHLTQLGQGPEGITVGELSEKLLRVILESATKAAAGQLTSLGKNIGDAAQALGTGSVQQIESVTKSIGNLLKKK